MKTSVYDLNSTDWKNEFQYRGFSSTSLHFWLDGIYRDYSLIKRHISNEAIHTFQESFHHELPQISKVLESNDGTVKFQMKMKDSLEVETVIIPFYKRSTICLSTQVGCAMNCSFCYTGTQGLKRHLRPGEIVGQYLVASKWLMEKNPSSLKPSVVFMGQGEPLHNVDNVKKAIEVLIDPKCVGIGHRQITLSTVGYLPALKELNSFPNINYALSLHSPFEEQRVELIPINEKFPLQEVLHELDKITLLKRQFINFEYLLIQEFNMSDSHVEGLKNILKERKALLNLIPFNPFPGSKWKRPTEEQIEEFKQKLVAKKIRVMVRNTKGDDILAACGQLRIKEMARNYNEKR